jgi:hypothetical protein
MKDDKWDRTDSQTLVERFDNKNSTHTSAFVAITFGAFSILPFLQGKTFATTELTVWYLIFMEIIAFPLGNFYCACRAVYYSMCVEKVKDHSYLRKMEDIATSKSIKAMPFIIKQIVSFRNKKATSKFFMFASLVYLVWLVLVVAVLYLPV